MKIQANCDAMEIDTNNFVRNTFDIATNGSLVLNKFRRNYWDRYEGFDINKDGTGDVPHNPVTLFSILVERYPLSMLLYRSAIVYLLDRSEKMLPGLTPANLKDEYPSMLPHALSAWLQTGKNR
jgi:nitrous oxidase accessory protein